jgi:hypothetical protein
LLIFLPILIGFCWSKSDWCSPLFLSWQCAIQLVGYNGDEQQFRHAKLAKQGAETHLSHSVAYRSSLWILFVYRSDADVIFSQEWQSFFLYVMSV